MEQRKRHHAERRKTSGAEATLAVLTQLRRACQVPWRESGFLDNPRVPQAVRLSRERVVFTPGAVMQGCGKGCRLRYRIGDDPPPEPDGATSPACRPASRSLQGIFGAC
jgi:hypothetical protein